MLRVKHGRMVRHLKREHASCRRRVVVAMCPAACMLSVCTRKSARALRSVGALWGLNSLTQTETALLERSNVRTQSSVLCPLGGSRSEYCCAFSAIRLVHSVVMSQRDIKSFHHCDSSLMKWLASWNVRVSLTPIPVSLGGIFLLAAHLPSLARYVVGDPTHFRRVASMITNNWLLASFAVPHLFL